jgi:hypothetical protein
MQSPVLACAIAYECVVLDRDEAGWGQRIGYCTATSTRESL